VAEAPTSSWRRTEGHVYTESMSAGSAQGDVLAATASGPVASATRSVVKTSVLRSVEELEPIRDAWLSLQGDHLTADPDYFVRALETDPHAVRPHVLVLERDSMPATIVVARIEDIELASRVGYARLFPARVRAITTAYGGLLGETDETACAAVVEALRQSLGEREADIVVFRHLEIGSTLHRMATTAPPFLCRQHVSTRNIHWEVDLPATLDEFLASRSKKTRDGIKRVRNKLQRDLGERASVARFDRLDQLDALFADVDAVTVKTYQHGLGVAFESTPRHREQTRFGLERGWFRAYVLYDDGKPIAFWPGVGYRGRFLTGTPGYDPAYAKLRPGTFLLMRLIEDLCREGEARILDLGTGDAEYKRHYCDRRTEQEDVLVYARTVRAVRINLVRTAVLRVTDVVSRAARRLRLYDWLKRSWRRRLQSAGGAG
jgi:CelD/BcsL family acetyltransferase involved in cellulose biosynthesis